MFTPTLDPQMQGEVVCTANATAGDYETVYFETRQRKNFSTSAYESVNLASLVVQWTSKYGALMVNAERCMVSDESALALIVNL